LRRRCPCPYQDPRLPGGGGYTITGFSDLKPAKFGVPGDEFVTFTKNFGTQYEHWNGVDITVNARAWRGLLVQGGTSTERKSTDNCDLLAALPEIGIAGATVLNAGTGASTVGITSTLPASMPLEFCHVPGTFLTQVKLLGAYTVPRIDVQVSASVQSLPGPEITAQYVATSAEVARPRQAAVDVCRPHQSAGPAHQQDPAVRSKPHDRGYRHLQRVELELRADAEQRLRVVAAAPEHPAASFCEGGAAVRFLIQSFKSFRSRATEARRPPRLRAS
jgi:hypothetical protein